MTAIDKLKCLFNLFGEVPKLSVKAKLAGLNPFFKNWSVQETNHFKRAIKNTEEDNVRKKKRHAEGSRHDKKICL